MVDQNEQEVYLATQSVVVDFSSVFSEPFNTHQLHSFSSVFGQPVLLVDDYGDMLLCHFDHRHNKMELVAILDIAATITDFDVVQSPTSVAKTIVCASGWNGIKTTYGGADYRIVSQSEGFEG